MIIINVATSILKKLPYCTGYSTCIWIFHLKFFCDLFHVHTVSTFPDVIMDPAETDNQDEMADKEPPNSSEELNTEPDEEPEITEGKSSFSCFNKSCIELPKCIIHICISSHTERRCFVVPGQNRCTWSLQMCSGS